MTCDKSCVDSDYAELIKRRADGGKDHEKRQDTNMKLSPTSSLFLSGYECHRLAGGRGGEGRKEDLQSLVASPMSPTPPPVADSPTRSDVKQFPYASLECLVHGVK